MPSYAYRCRTCSMSFDVHRSMDEPSATAVACPEGHPDTARVWSAVAVTTGGGSPQPAPAAGGGGCCGGGCCG